MHEMSTRELGAVRGRSGFATGPAIAILVLLAVMTLASCTPASTVATMMPVTMTSSQANDAPVSPAPGAGSSDERALAAPAPTLVAARVEEGLASWYGPGFAGRLTANGEVFNPNELTAAHKTLPFGTRVRVTSVRNGRSVVVRINDRGPFKPGRIIDLSRAAAEAIGMVGSGIARVTVAEVTGQAGAVRAGALDTLGAYEVVTADYPVGMLLVLSGVERSDRVLVRVVANGPEANGATDLLVSEELLAAIGPAVVIETE